MKYYLVGQYYKHTIDVPYYKAIPLPNNQVFMNHVDEYIRQISPKCGKIIFSDGELLEDIYMIGSDPYNTVEQYIDFYFNETMIVEEDEKDGGTRRRCIDVIPSSRVIDRYRSYQQYYDQGIQG
jgi:hypothetical protein